MSQWLSAAKRLEENVNEGNYFEAQSGIYALRRIQALLETTFPQMMFLLGEPGSGKSFLLHHLERLYAQKRLCVLIENPFLTPLQLLQRLLTCKGMETDATDVEALRLQAIQAYAGTDHLIMLDEAQLMSAQLREFVRILSDSKVFYFLIAMHKKEGEEMLASPHFHSRPHQVIFLGDLQPGECVPYLTKELQSLGFWDVKEFLGERLVLQAWRYSRGNFRNFKKCFYHLFLLLEHARSHGKKEFEKPSLLLLRMAAIRGRVLASELNTDDFDQLLYEAKRTTGGKTRALVASVGMLLVGAGVWYGTHYVLRPAKEVPLAVVSVAETRPILPAKTTTEEAPKAAEETQAIEPLHVKVEMAEEVEKPEPVVATIPAPQEPVSLEEHDSVVVEPQTFTTFLRNSHLPPSASPPALWRILPYKEANF